jgi:DNA-binding NtrC family response regulator
MKEEMDQLIERMINGGILFEEALQEFEKQFILKMLLRHNNNLSKASIALGIHRNTLSKRMEQYQNGTGPVSKPTPKTRKKRKPVAARLKIR